jgi:hypothetical protein
LGEPGVLGQVRFGGDVSLGVQLSAAGKFVLDLASTQGRWLGPRGRTGG